MTVSTSTDQAPGEPPPSGPRKPRSTAAILFLAVPVVIGLGILMAGGAWLIAIQTTSGQAKGEQVRLHFASACGQDYQTAMLSRLLDYGLDADFQPDGTLIMTMPGMPDDHEHMPIALTRPGKFEVWRNGEKTLAHFQEAGVQISFQGTATTVVMVDTQLDADGTEVRIDGMPIPADINGNELQLAITEETSQAALRQATDRAVQIRHPLPCDVQVTNIEPVK